MSDITNIADITKPERTTVAGGVASLTKPGCLAAAGGGTSNGALYNVTPVPAPAVLQGTAQLRVLEASRIAPLVPASAAYASTPVAAASAEVELRRAHQAPTLEPCVTGDALTVCRALDRPLEALSSLIEVVASHPHQSEGLRALLERVGNQAAALYALVQSALAADAAVPAPDATAAYTATPAPAPVPVPEATQASEYNAARTSSRAARQVPPRDAARVLTRDVGQAPEHDASRVPRPGAGQAFEHHPVQAPALDAGRVPAREVADSGGADLHNLTGREQEVLVLVADGLATAEIAHRLGITSATVRSHVQNILTRLGVCNRRQAAALLTGRLPPPARARLRTTRRAPDELPRPAGIDADLPHPQQIRCTVPGAQPEPGVAAPSSTAVRLTRREVQVLRCLAAGLGRSEIAERLYVSPHTARTHIQRVLTKLGVHSALAAMAVAREVGVAPAT